MHTQKHNIITGSVKGAPKCRFDPRKPRQILTSPEIPGLKIPPEAQFGPRKPGQNDIRQDFSYEVTFVLMYVHGAWVETRILCLFLAFGGAAKNAYKTLQF